MNTIGDRIEHIRGTVPQREFAKMVGVGISSYQNYIQNRREPPADLLRALAGLGWNPTWVLTGEGEQKLAGMDQEADGQAAQSARTSHIPSDAPAVKRRPDAPQPSDMSEYALVPHLSVRAAAGAGQVVESEQIVAWMAFRRTYLQMLGVPAKSACLVRVRGDSMEPDLRDGDTVLVDTSDVVVRDRARIYVLRYQGSPELVVKSVKRNADGAWDVVGGPHWPRATIEADADKPLVVGRVRWSGRTWD